MMVIASESIEPGLLYYVINQVRIVYEMLCLKFTDIKTMRILAFCLTNPTEYET